MGEPLGYVQSFKLTRGIWFPLLAASIVCEMVFAVPAFLVELARDYLPSYGPAADAAALADRFLEQLLSFGSAAAVAAWRRLPIAPGAETRPDLKAHPKTKRAAEAAPIDRLSRMARTTPRRRLNFHRAGILALGVLVAVDELDEGHRRVVAKAEAGLQDAGVAARTRGVARARFTSNSLRTWSSSRIWASA